MGNVADISPTPVTDCPVTPDPLRRVRLLSSAIRAITRTSRAVLRAPSTRASIVVGSS
ncbi:MAG: hypothetical protein R3D29_01730 [Nitratireductor sp.]